MSLSLRSMKVYNFLFCLAAFPFKSNILRTLKLVVLLFFYLLTLFETKIKTFTSNKRKGKKERERETCCFVCLCLWFSYFLFFFSFNQTNETIWEREKESERNERVLKEKRVLSIKPNRAKRSSPPFNFNFLIHLLFFCLDILED